MLLSIAMIVKNEERFLEKTLQALKPIKEDISCEIVVVDTGSEDDTLNIAKKYADRVIVETWKNDFSYMRNISISYCSGEWVLVVDADEVLENPKGITEFFTDKLHEKYNSAAVSIRNMISEQDKHYIMGSLIRMFRRDKSLRYEGKIHEQPKFKEPVRKLNAIFTHYGYNSYDYKLMIYKYERNLKLLEEQLEETPDDIYTLFQLAQTYSMAKKQKESFKFIRKAYDLCENKKNGIELYLYVYHFYAKELFTINEYNKVIDICEKVIKIRKGYLDFYYLLGNTYERVGNIKKAEEFYSKYLEIRNDYENHEGFQTSAVVDFSHSRKDEILTSLFKIKFSEEKYKEALNIYKEIEDEKIIKSIQSLVIFCMLIESNGKEFDRFIYGKNIDDEFIESVVLAIEKINMMKDMEKEKINLLKNKDSLLDLVINAMFDTDIEISYNQLNYEKFYFWKGTLLKKAIKKEKTNILLIENCSRFERVKYILNIIRDYDVVDGLVEFLEENKLKTELQMLPLLIDIEVELLKHEILSEEKYEDVFYMFLAHNINRINFIYNLQNINYEKINYISSDQDIVSFKLIYAMSMLEENKVEFLKILRDIIRDFGEYKKIIGFLKKINSEIVDVNITEEMVKEKYNLLKVVEELVCSREIDKAKNIIEYLNKIFKYDIDVLNTYGTIKYMFEEFDEALEKFNIAYVLDSENFDTLYNIANVFESINKGKDALYYYKKSLIKCKNNEIYNYISSKIEEISKMTM